MALEVQRPVPHPIYLNVYDLTPANGYFYWLGLGIYHSGLEAHGTEYAYGAHDYPTSGVFEVEPKNTPGFVFRESIEMGTTSMTPREFRGFIEAAADEYTGDSYHLIVKNCNHFTDDMCYRMTGRRIPGWINRLAHIGWIFNCLLPESLQVTAAQQEYRPVQQNTYTKLPKPQAQRPRPPPETAPAWAVPSAREGSPGDDVSGATSAAPMSVPGLRRAQAGLLDPSLPQLPSLLSYRWKMDADGLRPQSVNRPSDSERLLPTDASVPQKDRILDTRRLRDGGT
ncbi:predicted thiol peptidases [Klebsormidium nitens]|uniref:Predicted thiol peptidases n=1 Tax=Klebsormidium nitens TaxID=105231 RepID=A0A1Y1HPI4_KLENI|nr:predicted thiol peptidases [Klebsormidium nitens]|eukprot:GAQ80540.1 predicted thiol peptidases [Klebsormidium nitens]